MKYKLEGEEGIVVVMVLKIFPKNSEVGSI